MERAKEVIQNREVFIELRQIYCSYQDIGISIEKNANTANKIGADTEAIRLLGFDTNPSQNKITNKSNQLWAATF